MGVAFRLCRGVGRSFIPYISPVHDRSTHIHTPTTTISTPGVDVGELDVTLHVGFPSTVSSLMQQAGRAGRRAGA